MPSHTIKIHNDGHCTPNSQHALKGDDISWKCDNHSWTIDFTNGTPLAQSQYQGTAGVTVDAGAIQPNAELRSYPYTVTVQLDGTSQSADPDIIVDSSIES